MRPRRLHSDTRRSIFIGSGLLQLALRRSQTSSGRRLEAPELTQELWRARRLTDQPRHLDIEQGAELRLDPSERHLERLLPAQGPEPGERRHGRRGDRDHTRLGSRARRAHDARGAERRGPERVDAPTGRAGVEARPVTECVEGPDAEAHRHPRGRRRPLERLEAPHEQPVNSSVPVAVGGEARHALDDPRAAAESLEVLANAVERADDVEVVDLHQLAPARVEEDELAKREELEGAREARLHATRGAGDPTDLAEIARIEGDDPVALAEREGADHDRRGPAEPHQDVSMKPNSRSALASRRQWRRTSTVSARNTLMPKNASRSRRAAVPMRLSIVPRLPIRIPFCDSCSTKIVARMRRHGGAVRSASSSTRTAAA